LGAPSDEIEIKKGKAVIDVIWSVTIRTTGELPAISAPDDNAGTVVYRSTVLPRSDVASDGTAGTVACESDRLHLQNRSHQEIIDAQRIEHYGLSAPN
jgi:hypothetical protein